MKKHPIQPLEKDASGVIRFKENKIVRHLLDHGGIDLNAIAMIGFPQEDEEQFAQLIGYSLGGFEELSYASDQVCRAARIMAESGTSEQWARIAALEESMYKIKEGLRAAACEAFNRHPDDLA